MAPRHERTESSLSVSASSAPHSLFLDQTDGHDYPPLTRPRTAAPLHPPTLIELSGQTGRSTQRRTAHRSFTHISEQIYFLLVFQTAVNLSPPPTCTQTNMCFTLKYVESVSKVHLFTNSINTMRKMLNYEKRVKRFPTSSDFSHGGKTQNSCSR